MPLSRNDCLETKKTKIPVTLKQTATWKPAFKQFKGAWKLCDFRGHLRAEAKARKSLYCLVSNVHAMSKARESNYMAQSLAHLTLVRKQLSREAIYALRRARDKCNMPHL